jgi:hypothetical protein
LSASTGRFRAPIQDGITAPTMATAMAPLELTHILPLMIRTLVRNRLQRWRGQKAKFISSGAPEGGTGG